MGFKLVGLLSPEAQRGTDFIAWPRVRVGATVRRKRRKRNGFPGDLEPKLATGGGAWDTIVSILHPCVILTYPGCGAPWVLPWVAPGYIPVRIIRRPVAGATPLEGPGPSGASLPPEPWDGGFPPGGLTAQLKGPSPVRVPFNNPLTPRGRGGASRRMSRPPKRILTREAPTLRVVSAFGAKVRGHPWG